MCFEYDHHGQPQLQGERIWVGDEESVEFNAIVNGKNALGAETLDGVKEIAKNLLEAGDSFVVTKRTDYSCGCTDDECVGEFYLDEITKEVKPENLLSYVMSNGESLEEAIKRVEQQFQNKGE